MVWPVAVASGFVSSMTIFVDAGIRGRPRQQRGHDGNAGQGRSIEAT